MPELKDRLRGPVIEPADDAYDETRKLYNAMIDKRPGAIAQAVDVADVIETVNFAREEGRLLAIRGAGHNGPGLGSCDDGVVLDLGLMRGARVDPDARTVRVAPGSTQGDVDHATHPFGLAVPAGIVSTTGISGLTLGGGHGYLSRVHGLTIDHLLEADLVLADGSFVTASEDENEDLFWAIRGGGGNFGVVTSFLFEAKPVSTIAGGPMFFALEDAREVMEWYREYLPSAPRDVSVFLGLKKVPSTDPFPEPIQGRRTCLLVWCHTDPETGAAAIEEATADLPEPIFAHVGEMPYPVLQTLFDPLFPPGLQWYWKGDVVHELTDEAIDVHLEYGGDTPSELSLMHLYPIDGAVHDVDAGATAWSWRDATWSMVIAGIDPDPAMADALSSWAREYWDAIHPHSAGGAYVNFMMEEGDERVRATYGDNYERLARIKAEVDPQNLFRVNQNIPPVAVPAG